MASGYNTYELTYIVNSVISDKQIQDLINRVSTYVTENGGELIEVDQWGTRRLNYPIMKKRNGFYVNVYFRAPGSIILRLERALEIDDNVLRYLTMRMDAKMLRHYKEQKLTRSTLAPVDDKPKTEGRQSRSSRTNKVVSPGIAQKDAAGKDATEKDAAGKDSTEKDAAEKDAAEKAATPGEAKTKETVDDVKAESVDVVEEVVVEEAVVEETSVIVSDEKESEVTESADAAETTDAENTAGTTDSEDEAAVVTEVDSDASEDETKNPKAEGAEV